MENKKQRYFSTSYWSDKWVRQLKPDYRYLYVYLLTAPETNIAGVYETTSYKMAFDTGIDLDVVIEALKHFESCGKGYLFKDEWVVIPRWPVHQKLGQRGHLFDGVKKILGSLPEDVFDFLQKCGYEFDLSLINTAPITPPEKPVFVDDKPEQLKFVNDAPKTPRKESEPEDFKTFYSAYPKKKERGDALKAFKTHRKSLPPINELVAIVEEWKRSDEWSQDGGQFIPYPAKWIRRQGWLDERLETADERRRRLIDAI